jgi:hypothetical protein
MIDDDRAQTNRSQLDLAGNQVGDAGLALLRALTRLFELNLSDSGHLQRSHGAKAASAEADCYPLM